MPSMRRLLFCWFLSVCFAQKPTITQTQFHIGVVGSEVEMKCEQLTTDHEWMFWYYHSGGQGMRLVTSMLRRNEPTYEDGYKDGYKMDRTNGDKHSSLRIDSPTAKDQGVYFCASRAGSTIAYFGAGTVLSILGENEKQKPPSISIYRPSKRELEVQNFISLVCVASNFFPEHVKIRWFVNYAERINLYEPVPQRMSNSSAYSTSKRLTLTREEYFNPDSRFRCNAAFLDGNYSVSEEIKGETDCGISKESYTMYINQGKISYIMVLCKSGLYALVVLVLVWRKKVVASSY